MDLNIIIIVLLIAVLAVVFLKKDKKEETKDDQQLLMLNQRMDSLMQNVTTNLQSVRKDMHDTLLNTNKGLNERLDKAAQVIGGVENKLGKLEEANKKIYEVGKDIATLQEILRAPKLRGTIGELFLGDLLNQILPKDRFQLQYGFKSGVKVDAVIILKNDLLVPIDSKFPLENFRRVVEGKTDEEKKAAKKEFFKNVKNHIDAIASKYILADEGTLDFALMYIPAENVYYETVVKDDDGMELSTYAFSKRVIPVSPNNFYVYLQTILMGLKGMQIEKNVKEILDNLSRLQSDFEKFKEDYILVGKHLGNAKTKFEESERRLDKFEDKLSTSVEAAPQQPLLK